MRKAFLLYTLLLIASSLAATEYDYKFRLTLKDKGDTGYSIDKPEKFLSTKAIERRIKQGIKIDDSDLPFSTNYIETIEDLGGTIVSKSKWLKTITIHCKDSTEVDLYMELPFVNHAKLVWKGKRKLMGNRDYQAYDDALLKNSERYLAIDVNAHRDIELYGPADKNIKTVNGHYLHKSEFYGKGIDIAVIDGGFENLHLIKSLQNIKLAGHKSFVYQSESIFQGNGAHGLNVLSTMATDRAHSFLGTAPDARYYLLMSEESGSEYPVEEDYWVTAIEYADSIGVDVVNSSLGYSDFDDPKMNFKKEDLNGRTALISRAADTAVRKGMFVVCSAGNEGDKKWKTFTPPADAHLALTVGAIQSDSIIASFSSRGLTADMRIKPDVVALGVDAYVIDKNGLNLPKNGTSFSTPIITGLVACLWGAYPSLTSRELYNVIIQSANNFDFPDPTYGYGIPDMKKAMQIAEKIVNDKTVIKIATKKKVR